MCSSIVEWEFDDLFYFRQQLKILNWKEYCNAKFEYLLTSADRCSSCVFKPCGNILITQQTAYYNSSFKKKIVFYLDI